jgi:uncharacterized protein
VTIRLRAVRDSLDAEAVRHWCTSALARLRRHEHEINQLNVYPVPDGDTGTNLVLTLAAADKALAADPAGSVAGALRVMARGALLGARGNSGVIVAQLLRGMADHLRDRDGTVGGADLAGALAAAATAGYAAVAEPVEGTILTVATAAARAAGDSNPGVLASLVRTAADAAAAALARTPTLLPVLAAAGVVDAGGRGLVVLLDALVEVVTGEAPARPEEPPPAEPLPAQPDRVAEPVGNVQRAWAPTAGRETGSEEYAYEVQYLLDADDAAVTMLRTRLGALGDSLVVVGTGDGTWNVHVHVNDIGAAIEAGVEAGRPYQISVTRFEEQMAAPDPRARGAVVVASGDGLVDLFTAEGAVVAPARPSTAEVLAAVRATRAGEVVVLPNDPNTRAVAAAAADMAAADEIRVRVVPTHSPVQALAALAVRDPQRRFDDDVIAMAEAAGACRYAEVCYASRDALTVVGRCRAGDVLALVEGEVHLIGDDLTVVSRQLLDKLLGGGGELISLLTGADAPAGLGDTLTAHLADVWPFVEVQRHHGGQPHYPLVVGVE